MEWLNDVWVNWFEGEENGYNVSPFHEWRKDDFIEVIEQAPIVKVDSKTLQYIENELLDLPEDLLRSVYRKAYIRDKAKRIPLDHCFIATDGKSVIVVNTLGYKIPIRKSRLMPKQEKDVIEMAKKLKTKRYNLSYNNEKEYHILSPSPQSMIGLTRKERQLKQLLFMALDHLKATGNVAEVRYWLTEWKPEQYVHYQMMNFDEAWEHLYDEIKKGWSKKHYSLCEKLIKGHSFFEKLWELEEGTQVN